MIDNYIPKKYKLCYLFSIEDLAEIGIAMMQPKERHYICHSKKNRVKKKYGDRILARTEAYLRFIKAENRKRGNWDFLFNNQVAGTFKKNRFICFKIVEEMSMDKIIPSAEEHTLNQEGS